MIIELTWYEQPGGRKYESPMGGEIEAAEHLRIDCTECWYTKVQGTDRVQLAVDATNRFGIQPMLLPSFAKSDAPKLLWYEAIYVQYRCCGDDKPRAVLGCGYELQLYGAEQRPSRLIAQLGPKKESREPDQ